MHIKYTFRKKLKIQQLFFSFFRISNFTSSFQSVLFYTEYTILLSYLIDKKGGGGSLKLTRKTYLDLICVSIFNKNTIMNGPQHKSGIKLNYVLRQPLKGSMFVFVEFLFVSMFFFSVIF